LRDAPRDIPDDSDTEAQKKIDEITQRLEYIRRYIGPAK
jgi:hypothetical protein